MAHYKMSDVVTEVNERENNPANSKYDRFVGLEHYVSGEVIIRNYGSTERLESTMKVFQAGDILIARRNVFLKRASTVDFDGLTSGDSIVLRAKDPEIGRILPFVLNTDAFWDFADQYSDGTMSKRLSPKTLMTFEFDLPDGDELSKLADILWAANDTRESYQALLKQADELVKSQFIELFGDPISNSKSLPIKQLSDLASSRLGKMLDAKKQTGKHRHPYLANFNVQWFYFDFSTLNQMDFDEADQIEFSLENGDLMVCEGGEVGRCAIWRGEIKHCYFQKAVHRVRCNIRQVLPEYLAWWFKFHSDYNGFADIVGSKATIAHLPGVKLKKLEIPVPNIEDQERFVRFIEQLDKSKFELRQGIANINNLMNSLMQQDFSN